MRVDEAVPLLIAGAWRGGASGAQMHIMDPLTGDAQGALSVADPVDVEEALQAVSTAFGVWSETPAFERAKLLRRAANIIRGQSEPIATVITREQGKRYVEALQEVEAAADCMEWFADESRRVYGRLIPARTADVRQMAIRLPVGPVAAFTPWNYPFSLAAKKAAIALASGCTLILKGAEHAPGAAVALGRVLEEAGLPAGAINVLFGDPASLSRQLISSPVIRKISFTGSTAVGKQLMQMAGAEMKPATMELGGHAPVIVCGDTDVEAVAHQLASIKLRNAGQNCLAPTRLLVQEKIYPQFLAHFCEAMSAARCGSGFDAQNQLGPLSHAGRVASMESLVSDALMRGASLACGGHRLDDRGYCYAPTVLADVPAEADVMNVEPFGPIAIVNRYVDMDQALEEANRLPYGLAAYGYTQSQATATLLGRRLVSGMVSINHYGLALPETPFGGIGDSGCGNEGGPEAFEGYTFTKFITEREIYRR